MTYRYKKSVRKCSDFRIGLKLAKLSYGATCDFSSPERCVNDHWGTNFAEKNAWSLWKEASVPCMLIQARLSNSS